MNLTHDDEVSGLITGLREWNQLKAKTQNMFTHHRGRLVPAVGEIHSFWICSRAIDREDGEPAPGTKEPDLS